MATTKNSPAIAPTIPMTLDERIALTTAPAWRPESKGDRIENVTVVGLKMMPSEYGAYPKVVYRTQDGEYIAVHAFHTVLRNNLAEIGTQVGHVHNLVYLGRPLSNTRKNSDGDPQAYELYYVELAGAEVKAVDENFAF